ncbi:hypothetical protein JCM8097_006856 [Rhodosporidiobolus ruineniae]
MSLPSSSSSGSSPPSALASHLVQLCTLILVSKASSTAHPGLPGFTHARQLPLHTLAHLFSRYLHLLASTAVDSANQAGRTQVGLWDVVDALDEFGYGDRAGIAELREEALAGIDGVEEEADQLAQLAKGLQDHLAPAPPQPPIAQLSYDPLSTAELSLLELAASLPSSAELPSTPSASSSLSDQEDEDEELATPPPIPAPGGIVHAPGGVNDPSGASVIETGGGGNGADMIKPDPDVLAASGGLGDLPGLNGLDDLGLLTSGAGTGFGSDAAFFDSLGLGTPAPGGGVNGVGDLDVSIFQPLDLAGRPMDGLELLGPAGLDGLDGLTGFRSAEEEEEDARPFPAWRDQTQIPDWVPGHLPPFPGMEKESDAALTRRRRREKEREEERLAQLQARAQQQSSATVGRAAAALMLGGGAAGDPWEEAIPYSASSLATMASEFPNSLPTPSSPHAKKKELPNGIGGDGVEGEGKEGKENASRKKKRRRSLSPPPTSTTSLGSFHEVHPLIPHHPSLLRPSQLRRAAAGFISQHGRHPELAVSSDSLYGNLPYAQPIRQATLPPGFLIEKQSQPFHPFNSNLPYTVSAPVPYHPAASSALLPAGPPNPRIPTPLASIARELARPFQYDTRPGKDSNQLHPNLALFARLRRIGPPGPLGPKGEAMNYEYIPGTTSLQLSGVDWPERKYNAKLPKRFGEDEDGAGGTGGGGVGIKLKLGGGGGAGNKDGTRTREGSLAVGTPWGVGSPAASLPGVNVNATPGPSSALSWSTSQPFAASAASTAAVSAALDSFDFSSLGLPPASLSSSALPASTPAIDPGATPQADFDYPDFLLSAGGLDAVLTANGGAGTGAGADGAGGMDWTAASGGSGSGGEASGSGAAGGAADGELAKEPAAPASTTASTLAAPQQAAETSGLTQPAAMQLDPALSTSTSSSSAPAPPPPPQASALSVPPPPPPAPTSLIDPSLSASSTPAPPAPPPPASAPAPASGSAPLESSVAASVAAAMERQLSSGAGLPPLPPLPMPGPSSSSVPASSRPIPPPPPPPPAPGPGQQ